MEHERKSDTDDGEGRALTEAVAVSGFSDVVFTSTGQPAVTRIGLARQSLADASLLAKYVHVQVRARLRPAAGGADAQRPRRSCGCRATS